MTDFYNGNFDEDPTNALYEAIERYDKLCDEFARQVHTSEKMCFIDVGGSGGSREEADFLSEELKRRGCESFVQNAKIYAWGDACKEATRRKALEPLPVKPLPRDPKVERIIWIWQSSLPWENSS